MNIYFLHKISYTLEMIISDTVVKMGERTFWGCKNLKKVNISKKLDTISSSVFASCTNLESITIPPTVKSIEGGVFWECENLSNIIIPSGVTTMGSEVFSYIPSITVNVPFKEGEQPSGWDANWNQTNSNCTITVNYAK